MPAGTFELADEARRELDEAIAFFEGQRARRGFAFLEAIELDIDLLVRYPNAGRRLRGGFRAFALADWPYKIIYTLEDSVIIVWAIAHDKRRQGYWRKRLRR
jgi:toxin ParE1/3/4